MNTADKSKPYLFQLLEKYETSRERVGADESDSAKGGLGGQPVRTAEPKPSQSRPSGQILTNKQPVAAEQPKPWQDEAPARRVQNDLPKPALANQVKPQLQKTVTDEPIDSLRSQKKKSDRLPTEERVPTEDRDMFQSESLGLDVTINSEAINQFDYNESVDRED